MNIWALCQGKEYIKSITVDPWRVVEDQHLLSARDLVDSSEEHEMLEALIEESKPLIDKGKNYLLFTPFRYPPLKYGSRFGRTFESSLWYGSLELKTAFTEVAYYRLKFLDDTFADLGNIEISMTAFTAHLQTLMGVDLTQKPFTSYTQEISNKNSYDSSQFLGASMREDSIEAFLYFSARTDTDCTNVGVYKPSVFQRKQGREINSYQNWKCYANKNLIEFTRADIMGNQQFTFSAQAFC